MLAIEFNDGCPTHVRSIPPPCRVLLLPSLEGLSQRIYSWCGILANLGKCG